LLIGALYLKKLPADGRLPFPSIPSPGPSGPLAFRAAAVLACREVYQNILICQYRLAIFRQIFSTILKLIDYRHFKKSYFSTKKPPFTRKGGRIFRQA
ncbi:MAG: hypothetical protein U0O39_09200, partial [Akkermansia sp.]